MCAAVAACPMPPPDDICAKILAKIKDLISKNKHEFGGKGTHGLDHRFRELISALGRGDLSRYTTHVDEIVHQQNNLKRELEKYDKNGCGSPPPGAWSISLRRVPTPSDYGIKVDKDLLMKGAAAGAGLYVLYRVIRFIPSLLPPAWPTIPANLVIP